MNKSMKLLFSTMLISVMLVSSVSASMIAEKSSNSDIYNACLSLTAGTMKPSSAHDISKLSKDYTKSQRTNEKKGMINCRYGDKMTRDFVFEKMGVSVMEDEPVSMVKRDRIFTTTVSKEKKTRRFENAVVTKNKYRLTGGYDLAERLSKKKSASEVEESDDSTVEVSELKGLAYWKAKYGGTLLSNKDNNLNLEKK